MKANMGNTDRLLRVLLALLIVILYMTKQVTGTAAFILGIIAIVFLVTSLFKFCPLYVPFKVSTVKKK